LRHEFNSWAETGEGERMELDHRWFTERALSQMQLSSADRILDLGCGEGWACRLMAARLSNLHLVVGIDVSDEMVRRARIKSTRTEKVAFLCGSAERIPCRDKAFTKVLSIEAFYWFGHQERVLKELFRVVAPEGQLFILMCLYKDRPGWPLYTNELKHVRSADEYKAMLQATGWIDVHAEEWVRKCEPGGKPGGHKLALSLTARRPCDESALLDERYHSSEKRLSPLAYPPVPRSPGSG
jgi:arsenite methyltransferase